MSEREMEMQDPKFEFKDGRIWAVEGSYFIPEDEPVILFRGKDQGTLVAMKAYRDWLAQQDEHMGIVAAHTSTISERIDTIERWQAEHPSRTGMGCHTCAGHSPHRVRSTK